jgi:GntR family transcriptional regulator, galactonate operon transcriptional repressor
MIPEGGSLPRETEFAETFGVSRQAVREALKVLAAKGLVNSRRRAGTVVLPRSNWDLFDPDVLAWYPPGDIDGEFLNDLVKLRQLIEPSAAALAAARGEPERVARIGDALEAMRRATDDVNTFYEADTEFHSAIFAASGNALIDRLSTVIQPVLLASFMLQAKTDPPFEHSLMLHENLYRMIVQHDPGRAREAMEEILSVAASEVKALTREAAGESR